MYKIRDQYGHTFTGMYSFDKAVRIAHYMRELEDLELFVVDELSGRATSEVHWPDSAKDSKALAIAHTLLEGDFETRLVT
jgi:hypothetical protein